MWVSVSPHIHIPTIIKVNDVVENEEGRNMSAKERLQKMQAALSEQGAVDVKFYVSANPRHAMTEVATDVADFLEAALIEKRVVPLERLGDSVRQK